jgi:hypothetical protein
MHAPSQSSTCTRVAETQKQLRTRAPLRPSKQMMGGSGTKQGHTAAGGTVTHWYLARGKRKPKLHQKASHTQCTRTYPHHAVTMAGTLADTNTLPTPETDQAHSSHVSTPTHPYQRVRRSRSQSQSAHSDCIPARVALGRQPSEARPAGGRLPTQQSGTTVTAKGQDKVLRSVPRQTRSQTTIQPRD